MSDIASPKMPPKQEYRKHGPNLALYLEIGDLQDLWDNRWQASNLEYVFTRARLGHLGEFEYPFKRYLPKDGIILEAGCGTGRYVCALQKLGYEIEGIDYAASTISRIHEVDPTLNVRVGDINHIDCPDNHYAAYISIGVLEHNFNGICQGLSEAFRVLRPGGVSLISVPYLNWPRRRTYRDSSIAETEELLNGLRFYQDHLDVSEFVQQANEIGFTLLEQYPYLLVGGLTRDWRLGRWILSHNYFSWRLGRLFKRLCEKAPGWIRRDLSHMIMFICQKPA
jgi:SAM-dependent methyltransferase